MFKSRLFAVLAMLFACSVFSQSYSAFLISDDLKQNADAVVRNHATRYEIPRQNQLTLNETWAITVFNEEGLDYLRPVVFYDDARKVKDAEVRIFDKSGEEIDKIKKKDFRDQSYVSGGTLYSDSRLMYVDYTPVSYPFTMEFTYEISTSNTAEVRGHYFLEQYDISSEHSEYELIYDTSLGMPRVQENNFEGIEVKKVNTPGRLYYSANNIKAVKHEVLSPDFTGVMPNIQVAMNRVQYEGIEAEISDWKQIGSWMYKEILTDRQALPAATIAEVRKLTSGIDDVYEKSKIIYNYVQEQTRYISVQVGIGGIQPIAAIDVDEVKYGDCKGLTNYTIALLKAVGVEAYYTHVESGSGMESFSEDFPDLFAGDHVILAIPYKDGYIWSDCTSKVHPFGFIGDFTDNRNVLVIKPDGGELVRTVAYLDADNKLTTTATCTLSDNGSMKATITREAIGIEYDDNFIKWEQTRDEKDIKEWYSDLWSYLNGFHLDQYEYQDNKDEVVLTESLEAGVHDYLTRAGDQFLLPLNVFNRSTSLPPRYRNRKLPFRIKRGYLQEDKITFILPEGYKPESFSLPVELESEFGTYSMSCLPGEEGTLVYKRSFLLKHGDYSKDKYKEFRDFIKSVRSYDNSKMLLVPDTVVAEQETPKK